MLITKTNNNTDGVRKHTLGQSFRFGQVSVKFVFIGLFGAVALLYLAQSTQSTARTYTLHALEEEQRQLETDQERLKAEVIRTRSLPEIEKVLPTEPPKEGEQPAWEQVNKIAYITTPEPLAAHRP